MSLMLPPPLDPVFSSRVRGVFEAHVTVSADAGAAFLAHCAERGLKAITIALPRGAHPVQPMTATYHRGALVDVRAEVGALARSLTRAGFTVTRVKIEALGSAKGLPQTDAEASLLAGGYFEYHGKLRLPVGHDRAPLVALLAPHGAHLSRNARRTRGAYETRFVTLRAHGVGRATARARWAALDARLRRHGHVMRERVEEFTVLDSALSLDAGWLTPSPTPEPERSAA